MLPNATIVARIAVGDELANADGTRSELHESISRKWKPDPKPTGGRPKRWARTYLVYARNPGTVRCEISRVHQSNTHRQTTIGSSEPATLAWLTHPCSPEFLSNNELNKNREQLTVALFVFISAAVLSFLGAECELSVRDSLRGFVAG